MIAYMKLPVGFVCTHAGIGVGEDGASHQSVTEPAKMLALPHLQYLELADAKETEELLSDLYKTGFAGKRRSEGPWYFRLTRQTLPMLPWENIKSRGNVYIVKDHNPSLCLRSIIVATGATMAETLRASKILEKEDKISIQIINVPRIDRVNANGDKLAKLLIQGKPVITVQDASVHCLGDAVARIVATSPEIQPIRFVTLGLNDFGSSGKVGELYEECGISAQWIVNTTKEIMKR